MNLPVIILEGIILAFLLWVMCKIGIRNGAVGMVHLYNADVQKRAIEQGLTTDENITKAAIRFKTIGLLLYFGYIIVTVYFINGAKGVSQGFWQSFIIIMIMGIFDRLAIDLYWVGHTNDWIIPGTEDLRPYIKVKDHIFKWIVTLVVYPLMVALIALVMSNIIQ